ncbi:MAG TPA: hypothetical protein VGH28_04095 [Polyangiaceae bacterium]|jgi:hypothetical protein
MPTKKPSPKKPESKTKAAPSKPAEPSAPPADKADAKWRAAEERLTLRLAVLEDVVRRANVDLARRVGELEKRHGAAA